MKSKSITSRQALLVLATAAAAFVLPSNGESLFLLTEDGKLATTSTSAAGAPSTPVTITGVTAGESLVAIDVRPQNQQLYALGVNATTDTATVYLLEPRTALAVPVGTASQVAFTTNGIIAVDLPDPSVVPWDIDFNPAVDRIRVVAGSLNFRLNPNTGAAVDGDNGGVPVVTGTNPDGTINGDTTTLSAGAYTNNVPNNGNITTLYTLDDVTNALYIQNPPNAGTQTLGRTVTLGGSTLDISRASFDIRPGVNVAANNAAVNAGESVKAIMVAKVGGSTSAVYSLDLVTAQATLLGDTGLAIRSSAILSEVGAAVSLSSNGSSLNRFNPATPGTVTSVAVGVASLAAGEVLVGIDSRPQTGQLYGLAINPTANTGTLYLIDPQAGSLTAVGAQSQIAFIDAFGSPVDFPDPSVFGYGFDFNPTVDRIRVVVGTGLNFRLNPNTGAPVDGNLDSGTPAGTNTDATQNGLPVGSSGVTGAGYTNSYAQPLTGGVTSLYTLDSASSSFYIQNPPNAGTQVSRTPITVGGSPLAFGIINGFDIPPSVAVNASNTLAAGEGWFSTTVAGSTNLYRMDLTTGVATSFGAIGTGSTAMSGLVVWSTIPDISVERPAGAALVDNVSTVAFGNTLPGTPATATVTLRNRGSQPLSYSTTFDTGTSFSATTNGSGIIPGSSSVVLPLSFNPAVTGPLSDTLHILSNDPDLDSFDIALTGTGAILQNGESVPTTNGATRLNPLVNDTLGGDLTIIAVSDPAILIQGRTLIIPSGYTGQFTYTVSNGSVIGQGIVTATAGAPTVAPKHYNGVLTDSTGKVVGWSRAAISTNGLGSIRLSTNVGSGTGRLRFPVGTNLVSTPTSLGPVTVDRKPDGDFGALAIGVVLRSGAVLTGVLHAEMTDATPALHHFELASIDPALAGGGHGSVSVDTRASVRLRGILPDGNSFTASSTVTDNAAIAFYSALRFGVRPAGVIGGDLTLANNPTTDLSGELVWSKPPQGVAARGTELGGVDTILKAKGSLYDSTAALFTGNADIRLAGGNLLADEISSQSITGGVPNVPIGSLLSWSANRSKGTFTFTVDVPSVTRPVKGSGVYLQKSNRAVGYFPGTTDGGRVVLIPSAP
jgi:hypothetical protein